MAVAVVCTGTVFQLYEYPPAPPLAETVAVPFACVQPASVEEVVNVIAVGSVTVVD